MRFALFISFLFFFVAPSVALGGGNKKDTVQALVVSSATANPSIDFESLTGKEIILVVDSLLGLDEVPSYLIKEFENYIESKRLKESIRVLLTGFNDSSIYPSNNAYKTWDAVNLYPYKESLRMYDKEVELILEDTLNYCFYKAPVKGPITSKYGWRDGRMHKGLDIDLEVGDSVIASFDGMVRVARTHSGYGRVVIIRHYNGLETLYAHLHRIKVKTGDLVEAGQVIGLGGSSGRSTGSHLHYEVRYKGMALNPQSIINFNDNRLINDSIRLVKTQKNYVAIPKGVIFYTVRKGDNLFEIAQQFGTSIRALCELNGIRRNKILRIGQKLRIVS